MTAPQFISGDGQVTTAPTFKYEPLVRYARSSTFGGAPLKPTLVRPAWHTFYIPACFFCCIGILFFFLIISFIHSNVSVVNGNYSRLVCVGA
jgi:hypothetical protein